MKCIVHKRGDGGISIEYISPSLLAVMVGSGVGWDADRVEYEINKLVNPPSPETGKSDAVIRPYIVAVASGGVDEETAFNLVKNRSDKSDCSGCETIEDSEIPTDRTFREAWEWVE